MNLLQNLIYLSIAPLLTGCVNTGGGGAFPTGWKYMDTGGPEEYSCEWAGEYAQDWCNTGEHPNLCKCNQ